MAIQAPLVCPPRLRQGEHRVDHRLDFAQVDQLGYLQHVLAVGLDEDGALFDSMLRSLLLRGVADNGDKGASGPTSTTGPATSNEGTVGSLSFLSLVVKAEFL